MPANKQYLSRPGQRALKISAGILGGYFLSVAFHMAMAALLPFRNEIFLSATFSLFMLWVALMVYAFMSKNGWKIWGWYLLLIAIFSLVTWFFKA